MAILPVLRQPRGERVAAMRRRVRGLVRSAAAYGPDRIRLQSEAEGTIRDRLSLGPREVRFERAFSLKEWT